MQFNQLRTIKFNQQAKTEPRNPTGQHPYLTHPAAKARPGPPPLLPRKISAVPTDSPAHPSSLARQLTQRNEEEVKPRTWAAKRSSSAAATAAVEWPRPRSRSTRCSCRCSAKPRSFRSDDFISAPRPGGPSSPAPDRAPDRRRSASRSRKP